MLVTDPFPTAALLQSGRSAKFSFCGLEVYKAAIQWRHHSIGQQPTITIFKSIESDGLRAVAQRKVEGSEPDSDRPLGDMLDRNRDCIT
ncbi:MAG: hypothetical protein KGZ88_20505 [Methylomicrobium sp.]|nr:hypothetical protein [Methylomicrobium sp.]